jgi:hypothetical protein
MLRIHRAKGARRLDADHLLTGFSDEARRSRAYGLRGPFKFSLFDFLIDLHLSIRRAQYNTTTNGTRQAKENTSTREHTGVRGGLRLTVDPSLKFAHPAVN